MASRIFLGALRPMQDKINSDMWLYYLAYGTRIEKGSSRAIIAKGNIIEGIEAKE